jgi:hypothetical protein
MAQQDKATLKQAFQTGQSPTGSDFANLIDSQLNLAETGEQTVNGSVNYAGGATFASLSAATVGGAVGTFTTLNAGSASITTITAGTATFAQIGFSAGGTVTQTGEKTSAVTLNTLCGTITMSNAALTAATAVTFALKNSRIGLTDTVITNIVSSATFGAYALSVSNIRANSARISLHNLQSAGTLSEAVQVRFAVLKTLDS